MHILVSLIALGLFGVAFKYKEKWYSLPLPSLVVEFVSGFLLASVLQILPNLLEQLVSCEAISCIYEKWFDPNTWNTTDVIQRSVGIVAGLFFWWLVI